ncbi:hypothetical protein BH24ACT5_BH24ACT5_04870 [soil metagenome]
MPDNDTELGLDPRFETHLRRTLRAVAETIDDGEVSTLAAVRVLPVPTAPSQMPKRRAITVAAAAVALLGAAGTGAVIMAMADHQPAATDATPVSTEPSTPLTEDDMGRLAADCYDTVRTFHDQLPVGVNQPAPPEPATADVLYFQTGRDDKILITDTHAFYVCTVLSHNGEPAIRGDDPNVVRLPAQRPHDGEVQVVDRTSFTGADPTHGPGWVRVIGRVDPDVTGVALELPDGSTTTGQIHSGWFVLEGDLGAGVRDGDERINWTTRQGDDRSSRADLLDHPDEFEACAATPGCVAARLATLRQSAGSGWAQAEILSDLDVTHDELVAALRAYADCVNAADVGVTISVADDATLTIARSASTEDTASSEVSEQTVQAACSYVHLDLVREAHSLIDAQRRMDEECDSPWMCWVMEVEVPTSWVISAEGASADSNDTPTP